MTDRSTGASNKDANTPLLRTHAIGKSYRVRRAGSNREHAVLDDLNFEIRHGEVLALVGETGSGKSTIAKILARIERPSSGYFEFRGERIDSSRRVSKRYRADVQMIFQDPFASLNPIHRIHYHLARPLLRTEDIRDRSELAERVHRLLEQVGLSPGASFASRFPHECSGGQRQRIAIARALAVRPSLVLADEPTSMLDVSIRIDVLNLLRALKEEHGLAYLYITHDLASAHYFADRIIVLYRGQIVESAPAAQLIQNPRHPYTRRLLAAVPGSSPQKLNASRSDAAVSVPVASTQVDETGPGCRFATLCERRMPECTTHRIALERRGDRELRCIHPELKLSQIPHSSPKLGEHESAP